MREMYRRQLDAILFSLNQHAWDVSLGWATQLDLSLRDDAKSDMAALEEYLRRTPALDAVMLADSSFRDITLYQRRGDSTKTVTPATLVALMSPARDRLNALLRFQRVDYRKLEPFVLPDTASGNGHILIVFARVKRDGGVSFAGLLFRERQFIDRAISPQLTDLASEEFLLGIFRKGGVQPINASGAVPAGAEFQRKDLWLLPGHEVGIRLQGSTVDEVVRARFTRNLLLILLLDLILLAGALLIYRSVRAQTEFAQAKSAFVSNVSHELRTPLALIRMFAETLEMGRIKDEVKKQEYYATIVRESDRLTHLVNTILNFSRMEAGKRPYQFQTMDLNEAVRSVLETYRLHLEQHGMKPLTALSSIARSLCPPTPMRSLKPSSISSTMRSSIPDHPHTSPVRTEVREGKAVVEVEDHGIGIAPEHQKKVFDVFYRVPTGTVHETKGSGLGLSLVNHIMTAHNGTVELVSTPGKGSTFRLVFPLSQAAGTEHHVKGA